MDQQIDAKTLRQALGQFATGVTVITCLDQNGEPVGMTANSFSSLSLDPPLVLWSIARTSSNYDAFAKADQFAIHVLNEDQQALGLQFANREGDRFNNVETESSELPLLKQYLARFECSAEHRYEGGDHLILVGRVAAMDTQAGKPLMFFQGGFEQLAG